MRNSRLVNIHRVSTKYTASAARCVITIDAEKSVNLFFGRRLAMKDKNSSRSELVEAEDSSSTSGSDEDDDRVQPVIQVPPSNFSNVSVQNSTNVHFGNSAVYNGDVTVIMNPGAEDFVAERIRDKGLLAVTSGLQGINLDDDEKKQLEAVNRILTGTQVADKQPNSNGKYY